MISRFFVLLAVAAVRSVAAEISCEKKAPFEKYGQCCYLNTTTVISAANITLAGQEMNDVDTILFNYNSKIQFLPVEVHKKFPKLGYYMARNASITEISASHFEKLTSLQFLDLRANQIEFIPDYCFKNLVELIGIYLEDNKIARMNAVAFANTPKLTMIDLERNVCVDQYIGDGRAQQIVRQLILKHCSLSDVVVKEISCMPSHACSQMTDDWNNETNSRTSGCCQLEYGSFIDSPGYCFATNSNYLRLEAIVMTNQKDVDFLPVSVHEKFPNLKIYWIDRTSVHKISKTDFERMFLLEVLYLKGCPIEVIKKDTFEDLISLKRIHIVDNALTSLNGQAFDKLHNLEVISLLENVCIDKKFTGDEVREAAPEVIHNSCGFEELDSVEVPCEKFEDYKYYNFCFMDKKTVINATNFVVAFQKDEKVGGILFKANRQIEYLPLKISLKFPNLVIYEASECSVKQISKENFENLKRLRAIELGENKIRKIFGNTFKGLQNLKRVNLNKNLIKSINGRTFDQIPLLTSVDLRLNECIDAELEKGQSIKNFTRKIIQNCAFTETGEREFEKLFDIECGVGLGGSGFIVGGNETKRGQWPFMAALIFEPSNQFFCGGNIITASHVLTAAHCVHDKNAAKQLNSSDVVILLGRHNISLRAEIGSEIRGVKNIKISPRWSPRGLKFEGDLAVLELDRAVQFSELIQPICLTVEPEISQLEAGFVVGWGKSESTARHENVPRQVLISSVTADVCFAKDFKLGEIFAQGMYCAGGDEAGPCHGDSGGGYFVRYHGLWTLRGVVSSGSSKADGGCDVGRFSLFTNVLDYTEWIGIVIQKNDSFTVTSIQNKL